MELLLLLLVLRLCPQKTASHRSFSLNLPNLDIELEPPPPADEYDDLEPMEYRLFPSFRSKPPILLPNGSQLQPSGSVLLPNSTVLMTMYANETLPSDAEESPEIRLTNGTLITTTHHSLPEGLVLNVTASSSEDCPSLLLPPGSLVFRNGTLLVYRRYRLPTVFLEGFIPYCEGVSCHLKPSSETKIDCE